MLGTATVAELERQFQVGDFSWPFIVRSGPSAWPELTSRVKGLGPDKIILVADGGVPPSLAARVTRSLEAVGCPVARLRGPASEAEKNVAYAGPLIDRAFGEEISRRSVVVGLGGGLAGNMAGWLAHQFLRDAVALVLIPTTFLGVSDSTLSMKQGLNSAHGKNHVGGYKPPDLVWSHMDFMDTLPPDEIRAGLCELAKNVMFILGAVDGRYEEVAGWLHADARYTHGELIRLIDVCVEAKQAVMIGDPFEQGPALVLEGGHPQGHAFELLSKGRMPHGLAIGVGCLTSARMAADLGFADRELEQATEDLLTLIGTRTTIVPGITAEAVLKVMSKDNQLGRLPIRPGYAPLVLLRSPGRPVMSPVDRGPFKELPMYQVPLDVVRAGVQSRITL